MDPLRVKWWGPKHLEPSYICELSLHQKFQSPCITPSHKKTANSAHSATGALANVTESKGKVHSSDGNLAHFDIIDIYNLFVALKLKKSCFDTKFQCFFFYQKRINLINTFTEGFNPVHQNATFHNDRHFFWQNSFFCRRNFPLILQKDFILFFKIQFLKMIRHFHGRNIFSCPSAKEIFSGFHF